MRNAAIRRTIAPLASICAAFAIASCTDSAAGLGDGGIRRDGTTANGDATTTNNDATTRDDAAAPNDAGSRDGSAPGDAGTTDAMNDTDGGTNDDGGTGATRGICTTSLECFGQPCVAVPNDPLGWHTCEALLTEAAMCQGQGGDECCMSSECMNGTHGGCLLGPLFYCGGVAPIPANVCVYDECATEGDCMQGNEGVCVPTGAFGEPRSRCAYGDCKLDGDCGSRAGGLCMPFFAPCTNRFIGFHCTYDDSMCRSDADCTGRFNYCAPGMDGMTTCEQFVPPP